MFNGNIGGVLNAKRNLGKLCVVNIKTTGDIPYYHDMFEICVVPLNTAFNIDKDYLPFTMRMRIKNPERATSATVSKVDLVKLIHARDDEIIRNLFLQWYKKYIKEGDDFRIITIGYNMPMLFGFLNEWLGGEFINCFNTKHYIDLLPVARYIDDRHDCRGETITFCQYTLTRLFQICCISMPERGETLSSQAVALVKLYKEMLTLMVF